MRENFDKRSLMIKNVLHNVALVCMTTVIVGCAAGGVGSGGGSSDVGKLEREATLSYRSCTTDADCTYAQNGCCDCANGGEAIAVNIDQLVEFDSLFNCESVACTEMASIPACDDGMAKCESGICEFTTSTSDIID